MVSLSGLACCMIERSVRCSHAASTPGIGFSRASLSFFRTAEEDMLIGG